MGVGRRRWSPPTPVVVGVLLIVLVDVLLDADALTEAVTAAGHVPLDTEALVATRRAWADAGP